MIAVINTISRMNVFSDANDAADETVDEAMDEGKAIDEGDVVVLGH